MRLFGQWSPPSTWIFCAPPFSRLRNRKKDYGSKCDDSCNVYSTISTTKPSSSGLICLNRNSLSVRIYSNDRKYCFFPSIFTEMIFLESENTESCDIPVASKIWLDHSIPQFCRSSRPNLIIYGCSTSFKLIHRFKSWADLSNFVNFSFVFVFTLKCPKLISL